MMIAISCILLGVLPQGLDETETLRRLKSVRMSTDFRDLPITGALDALRDATGINLVLQSKWPDRILCVNLRLRDVSAETVLNVILKPRDLRAVFQNGALVIAPPERFARRTRLVVYDVRALNAPIASFPGVDINLAGEGFCCIGLTVACEPSSTQWGKDLERLIIEFTGGLSWNNDPDVSVNLKNGLLFVRQTPEAHAEIRRLLRKLVRAG